jgi:regulatory protein
MEVRKKTFSFSQALDKARKYCAFQERSQQEVRDKLYDLGLHQREVEQGIAQLIAEGFINEQRFAITFAGGKFRIKQWGKVKIRLALKAKKISDYCIRQALEEIPDKDYLKALEQIILKKSKAVTEKHPLKKKSLVANYAISRGFEPDLVWEAVNKSDN